ncbi:hypothetical protein AB0K18_22335 [Nonomuraea sp. NPDC049421]|uniref:hypothetical protein n=1 Tax=Nonomuraea sp. NPDC049421 TaxID=3155275 RepID=UPI00342E5283
MSDRLRPRSALLLVLGLLITFVVAVAATFTVLLQPPQSTPTLTQPTPARTTPTQPNPAQTVDPANAEYDDSLDDRLPAGSAIPLTLSPATRAQLAATGVPVENATVYLGMIFGDTPQEDAFHAVALRDGQHYWTARGDSPWTYRGRFDVRVCAAPVPVELIRAWGAMSVFGSTAPPDTTPQPNTC